MKYNRLIAILFIMALLLTGCTGKHEYIDAALEQAMAQEYETAMESLDEAENKKEDPALLARARGIVSIGLYNYDDAIKYFEECLGYSKGKVTEREFDVSYYLAVAQYKAGYIEDAIETYSAILGLKGDADGYLIRGELKLTIGEFDEAVRDFNQCIDYDSKDVDRYIEIFEILIEHGYEDAGRDYLDKALKLDGKLSELQKGKLAYCQRDYESARTHLEKARSTEDTEVTLYLGKTYEELGDLNYASSLYKTFLEKHPDDTAVLNQLGLCEMKLGDYDEALDAFETGLGITGNTLTQTFKYNEIIALEYKGDFDKAAGMMKKYMKSYPDDEAAAREYKFLKTRVSE